MSGIVSYGSYIPRFRIKPEEIARVWGEDAENIKNGIYVLSKSVPAPDEDVATISVEAARNSLKRCRVEPENVGAIFVGSESHPYAVKPTATIVAAAIGVSFNLFSADYEFACKAGTAAMQNVKAMVDADFVKYGMAIGADTSQGAPGDVLEYTASAGGTAMLLGKENVIAEINSTLSVYIIGNGPGLGSLLKDMNFDGTVFVADSAIEKYLRIKGCPDYIFTDLDGPLDLIKKCSDENVRLVVHAHGDNGKMIENYVPSLRVHMGTTQNRPVGVLRNFGGFTDGDRAAFFAHYFGAPDIILVGFDFSRPSTKEGSDCYRKAKKLKWAEILLARLALMRGSSLKPGPVVHI